MDTSSSDHLPISKNSKFNVHAKYQDVLDRIQLQVNDLDVWMLEHDKFIRYTTSAGFRKSLQKYEEAKAKLRTRQMEKPGWLEWCAEFITRDSCKAAKTLEIQLNTLEKRLKNEVTKTYKESIDNAEEFAQRVARIDGILDEAPHPLELRAWLIHKDKRQPKSEITVTKKPSELQGTFGVIHIGRASCGTLLALKGLKPRGTASEGRREKALMLEGDIWEQLDHPHILPFMGSCVFGGVNHLVSPYIENGDLLQFLQNHPLASRTQILFDIAGAVAYLHGRPSAIVHGDIKPANVIINGEGHTFLCDFGLSKEEEDETSDQSKNLGTTKYMSPGRIAGEGRSPEDDVWAFGITMVCVLRSGDPFQDKLSRLSGSARRDAILVNGIRPEVDKGAEWEIAKDCWNMNSRARQSMVNVRVKLFALLDPTKKASRKSVIKIPWGS